MASFDFPTLPLWLLVPFLSLPSVRNWARCSAAAFHCWALVLLATLQDLFTKNSKAVQDSFVNPIPPK